MNTQEIKKEIFRSLIFFGTGLALVGVTYAAISWPATPSGETDGGRYSAKLVPSGAVMAFKTSTCPTGWSPADGTNGNPDLRGEFVRGWDNGRGVDTGRAINSAQNGSRLPQMYVYRRNASEGLLVTPAIGAYPTDGSSVFPEEVENWTTTTAGNYYSTTLTPNGGTTLITHQIRPRNVALLFCVKN